MKTATSKTARDTTTLAYLIKKGRELDEESFAGDLDTARAFWRHYRELVEADEFPPALLKTYREVHGHDPSTEKSTLPVNPLEKGYKAHLQREARALFNRLHAAVA